MKPSVDLDSLKTAQEFKEAFEEVRQAYIDEYKGYLPEDELVVLAQFLTNIDMCGYSYPHKSLLRIKELIAKANAKREESRRHKLKRTFEEESDASESED